MKSKKFVDSDLLITNVVEEENEVKVERVSLVVPLDSQLSGMTIAQNISDFKLVFNKVNDTATIPSKRLDDAGYDLYANYPEGTDHVEIKPHHSILVPTGIRTAIPQGFVGLVEERGSTGSINLKRNAGVVDSNYRGEIFVALYNGNDKIVVLSRYLDKVTENANGIYYPMNKAIAQMVVIPVPEFEVVEYTTEEFNKLTTERGEGKLGSSGK